MQFYIDKRGVIRESDIGRPGVASGLPVSSQVGLSRLLARMRGEAVDLSQIYLVTDKLDLATASEIREAETALGCALPSGYRDFVTTLGSGECDGYFRVYSPTDAASSCYKLRSLFKEYAHFWDDDLDALSEEQLGEVVVIGDTIDTDYVVFHPSKPRGFYILPRNDEQTYRIGATFAEALTWLTESDLLVDRSEPEVLDSTGQFTPAAFHYFDTGIGQSYADFYEQECNTPALFAQVVARLTEMARTSAGAILVRCETGRGRQSLSIYKLFVREAAAMVQLQGSDRFGPRVFTEFSASRVTPELRSLFAHLVELGLQHWGR